MSNDILSRLSLSGTVRAGATVQARWIASHPMETGFRVDDLGRAVRRNVITLIRVLVNGRVLLEAEPGTGLSANPYLEFSLVVPPEGGLVTVEWLDDAGRRGSAQQALVLAPAN